jgi:predicted metal-dependent peptidase
MAQPQSLSPRNMIGAARIKVWKRHPYFTAALFNLKPIERRGIEGVSVDDGMRLWFDPEWLAQFTVDDVACFLAHEVQHVVRRHTQREAATSASLRGRYERVAHILRAARHIESWHHLWNVAADFEINDDLVGAGWVFPKSHQFMMPKKYDLPDDRTGEFYAKSMIEWAEQQQAPPDEGGMPGGTTSGQPQPSAPSSQAGEAGPQGDRPSDEDGEEDAEGGGEEPEDDGDSEEEDRPDSEDEDEGAGEGGMDDDEDEGGAAGGGDPDSGDDAREDAPGDGGEGRDGDGDAQAGAGSGGGGTPALAVGGGSCGGCAGHHQSYEAEVGDDLPDPTTNAAQEVIERQVARAVLDWRPSGGGRGVAPGNWLAEWARSMFEPPKVDWRKHLAAEVRGAVSSARGRVDWAWGRPSRRREVLRGLGWGDDAPLLPELQGPDPKVVIVVDTSGSMGRGKNSRLARAGSEVIGILRSANTAPHVITVDSAVFESRPVRTIEQLLKMLGGHGGTDMRVGLKAAADRRIAADVCILLTDGATPWPTIDETPRNMRVIVATIGHKYYFDQMPAHLKKHGVYMEK